MTEAISGRDWLAELAAVGDGEVFLRAVGEVAAARPDLADAVCAIAARGWDEVFVQEVRTVFETKAKAKAREKIASLEEGRRVRERLAAGAIAEIETIFTSHRCWPAPVANNRVGIEVCTLAYRQAYLTRARSLDRTIRSACPNVSCSVMSFGSYQPPEANR